MPSLVPKHALRAVAFRTIIQTISIIYSIDRRIDPVDSIDLSRTTTEEERATMAVVYRTLLRLLCPLI